jgi:quercetin dioxygenase-like cupin family protein
MTYKPTRALRTRLRVSRAGGALPALFVAFSLFAIDCTQKAPQTAGHDAHQAVVEILAKSGASWNGAALPAYPTTTPEITIARVTLLPHSVLPLHKHPIINAGYLVSGAITVIAESGEERKVRAGDGLIELVNTWHYGRNDGDEPAVIVAVYVGTEGMPLSVKK